MKGVMNVLNCVGSALLAKGSGPDLTAPFRIPVRPTHIYINPTPIDITAIKKKVLTFGPSNITSK